MSVRHVADTLYNVRMNVLVALVLAGAVTASACGGGVARDEPVAPTGDEVATAPRLFTVEQLRAGTPQGRVIELRIEAAGKPTIIDRWDFVAVDEVGATIRSVTRDEAGAVIAEDVGTSTWAELHAHGAFPAATTTVEDGVDLSVPAGTFMTRLYTVTDGDTTRRFWFAVDLPGPPVQFTTEQGGTLVLRASMLRAR